jgi:hypothetical protein
MTLVCKLKKITLLLKVFLKKQRNESKILSVPEHKTKFL